MVEATVKFDQESYQPGELVTATFFLDITQRPLNARILTIALRSVEITSYWSSSGEKHRRGEHLYGQARKEIILATLPRIPLLQETLTYTLPPFPIPPIQFAEVAVAHQAYVVLEGPPLDPPLQEITHSIPYNYPPPPLVGQPIHQIGDDVELTIGSDVWVGGTDIPFSLALVAPLTYKEVHLALYRKTALATKKHSRTATYQVPLVSAKTVETLPTTLRVPHSVFYSQTGALYHYTFWLRITFLLGRNAQHIVEVPIQYRSNQPPADPSLTTAFQLSSLERAAGWMKV